MPRPTRGGRAADCIVIDDVRSTKPPPRRQAPPNSTTDVRFSAATPTRSGDGKDCIAIDDDDEDEAPEVESIPTRKNKTLNLIESKIVEYKRRLSFLERKKREEEEKREMERREKERLEAEEREMERREEEKRERERREAREKKEKERREAKTRFKNSPAVFSCQNEKCGKRFLTKMALNKHRARAHSRPRMAARRRVEPEEIIVEGESEALGVRRGGFARRGRRLANQEKNFAFEERNGKSLSSQRRWEKDNRAIVPIEEAPLLSQEDEDDDDHHLEIVENHRDYQIFKRKDFHFQDGDKDLEILERNDPPPRHKPNKEAIKSSTSPRTRNLDDHGTIVIECETAPPSAKVLRGREAWPSARKPVRIRIKGTDRKEETKEDRRKESQEKPPTEIENNSLLESPPPKNALKRKITAGPRFTKQLATKRPKAPGVFRSAERRSSLESKPNEIPTEERQSDPPKDYQTTADPSPHCPLQCRQLSCNRKRFFTRKALAAHYHSIHPHLIKSELRCQHPSCRNKVFSSQESLSEHYEKEHSANVKGKATRPKLKCSFISCEASYVTKKGLIEHMNKCHSTPEVARQEEVANLPTEKTCLSIDLSRLLKRKEDCFDDLQENPNRREKQAPQKKAREEKTLRSKSSRANQKPMPQQQPEELLPPPRSKKKKASSKPTSKRPPPEPSTDEKIERIVNSMEIHIIPTDSASSQCEIRAFARTGVEDRHNHLVNYPDTNVHQRKVLPSNILSESFVISQTKIEIVPKSEGGFEAADLGEEKSDSTFDQESEIGGKGLAAMHSFQLPIVKRESN